MGKPRSHKPTVSTKMYDYLNNPRKEFADYVVSEKNRAQEAMYRGTDISAKVEKAATRQTLGGDVAGNRGFSGQVSKGTRPKHKADPRGFKRV